MNRAFVQQIESAFKTGKPFALITVVSSAGSAPQVPGASMLVFPDGSIQGTVGGGAVEHHLMGLARTALSQGASQLVQVDLGKDLGMLCGGRMTAFIEPLNVRPGVVVFGAGHVARALAPVLLRLDFPVTVVDDRPEWATPTAFPTETRVVCQGIPEFGAGSQGELENLSNVYILVMTRAHAFDYDALRMFVGREVGYLGIMASRSKAQEFRQRLVADGVAQERIDRVHMPVGFPIRSSTPEEIAITIAAELLQVRNGTR